MRFRFGEFVLEPERYLLRLAREHLEHHPDDTRALCLGAQACRVLEAPDEAEALARRAREIDPEETCTLYNTACLRATQGRSGEALDLLEQAARSGYRHRAWAEHDPDLAPLRQHPRFRALLDRMERPAAPAR